MKSMKTAAVAGVALALALGLTTPAAAQALEKKSITLGVGGKGLLYYLPLTHRRAARLLQGAGPRRDHQRFPPAARSRCRRWSAARSTSSTGAYEHTIRMQAKGQDIRAVIELGRFPGIVLAVKKEKAAQREVVRRPEGLQDRRDRARLLDQFLRQVI